MQVDPALMSAQSNMARLVNSVCLSTKMVGGKPVVSRSRSSSQSNAGPRKPTRGGSHVLRPSVSSA